VNSVTKSFLVENKQGLINGTDYLPKVISSSELCPIVSLRLVEKKGTKFKTFMLGKVAIININGDIVVDLKKSNKYDIFIEFVTRGGSLF
jgi:hypothetical protein